MDLSLLLIRKNSEISDFAQGVTEAKDNNGFSNGVWNRNSYPCLLSFVTVLWVLTLLKIEVYDKDSISWNMKDTKESVEWQLRFKNKTFPSH